MFTTFEIVYFREHIARKIRKKFQYLTNCFISRLVEYTTSMIWLPLWSIQRQVGNDISVWEFRILWEIFCGIEISISISVARKVAFNSTVLKKFAITNIIFWWSAVSKWLMTTMKLGKLVVTSLHYQYLQLMYYQWHLSYNYVGVLTTKDRRVQFYNKLLYLYLVHKMAIINNNNKL